MHRDIVPTEKEFAPPERTIRFLPARNHIRNHVVDDAVQLRKAAAQENSQVNAFRIIVELMTIDSHAGASGKWHGQAVGVEQVFYVIGNATLDGSAATCASRKLLNFCESLEHEAGMEMVDEITLAIECVVPGAILILRSEHEIQIPLRRLPIARI